MRTSLEVRSRFVSASEFAREKSSPHVSNGQLTFPQGNSDYELLCHYLRVNKSKINA